MAAAPLLYRGRGLERNASGSRLYPLLIAAAIAVTLFGLFGIAAMMGYGPERWFGNRAAITQAALHQPCAACGVVETVLPLEAPGSGVGALLGTLGGVVFGNAVGSGGGNVMALAGAQTGQAIESQSQALIWQTRIRMDDGSMRSLESAERPSWQRGARLRFDAHGKPERLASR